jgi:16S rRNA C967 or C1407 C5-methylase (RsmB/RsmF family)
MHPKKGPEGFDAFYHQIYQERWLELKQALLQPRKHYIFKEILKTPYYLDPASVFCANCLPLLPNSLVGDLCAAPGGKTLVLASRLPEGAYLIANEKSASRRKKLHEVLRNHLPADLNSRISIKGLDAGLLGKMMPQQFDSILLDVPCSSERHLMEQPKFLAQWGPGRGKSLAIQALALAASAFDSLKPGGYLLYSTCALNPLENDGVWDRMLKKRLGWQVVPLPEGPGMTTKWGRHILPDSDEGMGPLYLTLIRKNPEIP